LNKTYITLAVKSLAGSKKWLCYCEINPSTIIFTIFLTKTKTYQLKNLVSWWYILLLS